MRDFMISVLCLGALLAAWSCFSVYCGQQIGDCEKLLDDRLLPVVETGDWQQAETDLQALEERWRDFRRPAAFFLDAAAVNEANCTMSRARQYIRGQDSTQAAGELAVLKEQLISLYKKEMPAPANIL